MWAKRIGAVAALLALWVVACGGEGDADSATKPKPKDAGSDAASGCTSGQLNCDGDLANGCEIDGQSDEENCGACGVTCGLSHATAVCESGSCTLDTCDTGYADCDGDPSNGCETFLAGDPENCGSCDNACPTGSGEPTCTDGHCDTTTCPPPLADCDNDASNGCETTLNDDPENCGACANACDFPHAAADCEQSTCAIGPCDTNYENCDGVAGNGCEIDTQTSLEHCGGCNSACGDANGSASCSAGQCLVTCNAGFDDCDNVKSNGCESTLATDVGNCGACNNVCPTPPAGMAACVGGVCGVTGCAAPLANCDGIAANGCETNTSNDTSHCGNCNLVCPTPANASAACTAGSCGLGSCSAGFQNCNGQAGDGCEANTATDVNHCGACNSACSFPNAAASCNGGSCSMGACGGGFENCNGSPTDGCEANLTTDVNHCGSCGTDCSTVFPNSDVACNGSCSFVGCLPGFYDIDNSSANGCEYACTFQSATDLPDDSFIDANCDGIDGNVNLGVFVATSGNDSNPGTKQLPLATVNAGIGRAVLTGKTQVFISNGTYNARVTMMNGIGLYGGYSAQNGWVRSSSFVSTIQSGTVQGGIVAAMTGASITAITTVDRLTITTAGTSSPGVSNYGFLCDTCPGIRLRNSNIHAGNAGAGAAGGNGTAGANGSLGAGGVAGSCDNNGTGAPGGLGGNSLCGRTGGNGGKGGNSPGSNAGATGATGVGGTAGGSGGGGGDPGGDGSPGSGGLNGGAGASGPGGVGGNALGGLWVTAAGGTGTNGTNGNGGGGGGGGGSQSCTFCNDGYGNGGGGGGGGGCGGTGAFGGAGGGGSFGVFLVSSTGAQLTNNIISSSNGGNGGAGGSGGGAGIGANGGTGGSTCTSEVGQGGNGGKGGNGGAGGPGGGGAGGPSYGVFRSNTTISTASNSITHGNGGLGGVSPGNDGANGAGANVF